MPRNASGRIVYDRKRTVKSALSAALAQRGKNVDGAALPGTAAIYIMRAVDRIKVGVSQFPAYRNDELKKQTKMNIEIQWVARGIESEVRELEQAVHKLLRKSPFHIRGEWYRASVDSVANVVLALAKQRGIILDRERMEDAKDEPELENCDARRGTHPSVLFTS
jgi:hypothetical protein